MKKAKTLPEPISELLSRNDCPVKGKVILMWVNMDPGPMAIKVLKGMADVTSVIPYCVNGEPKDSYGPGDTVILYDGVDIKGMTPVLMMLASVMAKQGGVVYVVFRKNKSTPELTSSYLKKQMLGFFRDMKVIRTKSGRYSIARCT